MKKVLSKTIGTALLLLTTANIAQAAGSLVGSVAASAGLAVNLTQQGTTDWAQWGYSGTSFNHKAVSGNPVGLISNYTLTDVGAANSYGDNALNFSWTDGTPTASVSATTTGIYYAGGPPTSGTQPGTGFEFTVPADTTSRTVKVYVGGVTGSATLIATLSDGSAATYTDSSASSAGLGNTDGNHYYAVYTLVYKANSAGQTLKIDWLQTGGGGNITLQAATLVNTPTAVPAAPTGVSAFAGDARVTIGWNPVPTADTYTLKRGTSATGPFTTVASGLTSTGYADTGLTNGTTYYYVVSATNIVGESPNSSPAVSAKPTAGVDGDGIKGEYFNEKNLPVPTFDPANFIISEIDPTVNFDVDASRPAGVPHDNISVRWTGAVKAQIAGAYVFTTASDDGIRLYVDGYLAIDDYVYQGTTTRSSAPFNFAAGSLHTIRVLWFQGGGGGVARLSWSYPGQATQIIPQYALFSNATFAPNAPVLLGVPGAQSVTLKWSQPDNATSYTLKRSLTAGGPYTTIASNLTTGTYTDPGLTNGTTYYYVVTATNAIGTSPNSNEVAVAPAPPVIGTGDGLYGTYYNGDALDYTPETTAPIAFGISPFINYTEGNTVSDGAITWPNYVPHDHFTTVWTGLVQAPFTGAYTFRTVSDDGSRLSLDTGSGLQVIVDNSNYQGPTPKDSATINLVAGQKYPIKYEFFQGGGGLTAQLYYNPLNSGNVIVPQSQLYSNITTAPLAVTNLAAAGGNKQVLLSWTGTQYAASYNVLRGAAAAGPFTTIKTGVTTTGYNDTTAANGTTYYYVVQAVNAVGTSSNSNVASATPVASKLVLRYNFEEGPKGANPDVVTDVSGSGNNGQMIGGDGGYTLDSFEGKYAALTTIDTANNNVPLTYVSLHTGFDFGNQFTVFTYTKIPDAGGITTILGAGGSGGSTGGFTLYVNDYDYKSYDIVFETNTGTTPGPNVQSKARTPANTFVLGDNKYHAVAAVVNRTGGTVSIYFDGKEVLTNAPIDTTFPTAPPAGAFLGLFTSLDEVAVGSQFDDFRVYQGLLSATDIAALSVSGTTVTGKVALEGVSDLSATNVNAPRGTVHIEFRTPGTTTALKSFDVALTPVGAGSPLGTFSVSGVPAGTYDVALKGSKQLRVVVPNVAVTGSSFALPGNITLPGGDATNDNIVDIGDFGILVNSYNGDATIAGSGYNAAADFNYDGVVDIGDFGVLVNEYNNSGAP